MKQPNRELVLHLRTGDLSDKDLERELDNLELLLRHIDSPVIFYKTHELINRNAISRNKEKLTACFYQQELKPFRFLVCMN
jgi:hypothetical protein